MKDQKNLQSFNNQLFNQGVPYSLKRTDLRTERSENPQAIHEREVYAANFHKKFSDDPASFFFMDEVGFSVSMWHAYGYSP